MFQEHFSKIKISKHRRSSEKTSPEFRAINFQVRRTISFFLFFWSEGSLILSTHAGTGASRAPNALLRIMLCEKKLSLWSFSKHANMYCTFLHEKVFGTCYEKISFPQVVLLPLAFAFWTWMHWYFSHHKNPGGVKINKRKFWRFSMIHRYFSKIHHSHYNGFIKASQFVTLFARVFYLCTSNMYGMVWYTIVPL